MNSSETHNAAPRKQIKANLLACFMGHTMHFVQTNSTVLQYGANISPHWPIISQLYTQIWLQMTLINMIQGRPCLRSQIHETEIGTHNSSFLSVKWIALRWNQIITCNCLVWTTTVLSLTSISDNTFVRKGVGPSSACVCMCMYIRVWKENADEKTKCR